LIAPDIAPTLPDTKSYTSKRERFIEQTLKLNHDPFARATAELELLKNSEDPPFFSYFITPPTDPVQENLLEELRQANPVFIFGAAGSGKTTLRYALEALCRAVPDRTLVVTYTLGKVDTAGDGETAVWQALTEALATDLFVQITEQWHTLGDVESEMVERLGRFWYEALPTFGRKLHNHLTKESNQSVGVAAWWTWWKRTAVRYTPLTPARQTLFQQLLSLEETAPAQTQPYQKTFYQGLQLAKEIGFTQIYLLVDVVENRELTDHFSLLLQTIHTITSPIPLYPKLFLPESWQDYLKQLATSLNWLTPQTLSAIIKWDKPEALHAILANRFRSAGSWIRGFNTIAGQEIADRLEEMMIQTADQSPRRLLQLANLLLDVHANREPDDWLITAEDWNNMCQLWNYGPPLPPLLTTPPPGE
jgi:energy-coupling factor transporter ATP-binding protein EcfA2